MRQITLSRSLQASQTDFGIIVQTTELSAVIVEKPKARTFTPERLTQSKRADSSTDFTTPIATKRVEDNSAKVPSTKEGISSRREDTSLDLDVDPQSWWPDGDLKSSWLQRRCGVLYESSKKSEDSGMTKAEKCTNCCCQACDWCCKCPYEKPELTRPQLTKMRTLGVKSVIDTVCSDIFTASPVGSIVRECVIYFEVLLMLGLWVNVLVGFVLNNHHQLEDKVFRICQLGLSTIGVSLTFLDLVHHWVRHRCKTCAKKAASIEWYNNTPDKLHLPGPDDEGMQKCCRAGCAYERVDIIRLFVTPAIAYPLLLLSMFDLLSQLILCRTDVTTFLSFLFSIVIQFGLVYLVRMFIFVGTIYSVQKVRTGGKSQRALMKDSTFQQYFVANAFGHMFVELLLIATIGIRFYFDYQVFWNSVGVRRPTFFLPTYQLWCMMVFGYFAAPIGMVLFHLSHDYWSQRFFIKFFVDGLDVLREKTNKKIAYEDASSQLENNMEEAYFRRKFMYSFLSPTISMLCIAYCGLLLGFAISALLQSPAIANFGIIAFYAAATVITMLVNLYACAIVTMWVFVTVVIIIIIVSIIAMVLLVCACIFCLAATGSSSSSQ